MYKKRIQIYDFTQTRDQVTLTMPLVDYLGLSREQLEGILKLPTLDKCDIVNLDLVGDDKIFSKRKILKSKGEKYELPSSDTFFSTTNWTLEPMEILKTELNATKCLLNDLNIDEWHIHTRNMNPLSSLIKEIRSSFSHEFCSVAWCKLFEILSCHNVLPKTLQDSAKELDEMQLSTVHLCECPGAFISALNHFLKSNYTTVRWDWLATTLNPYYEGNDRSETLIQDEIILSSLYHWYFLKDNTGNIKDTDNILSLQERTKHMNPILLVTADGSIDCSDSPDFQESVTSDLHLCEIIAAVSVLAEGGSFLLKMFTFFESNSISKLYLLACFFEEVEIVKPATSKEGNSEVYVLCKQFAGQEVYKREIEILTHVIGKDLQGKSLLPLDVIPKRFLNRVIDASFFFAITQANSILRNLKVYPFGKDFYSLMATNKSVLSQRWITLTGLKPLRKENFIFHLKNTRKRFCLENSGAKIFGGSYNTRLRRITEQNQPSWINVLSEELGELTETIEPTSTKIIPIPPIIDGSLDALQIGTEKPLSFIRGSRFCNYKFLSLNNALQDFILYCFTSLQMDSSVRNHILYQDACCPSNTPSSFLLFQELSRGKDLERGGGSDLDIICYNENVSFQDLNCPDTILEKKFFLSLIQKLDNMKDGQSLFICKFPLLTRMQFGFTWIIARLFTHACICVDSLSQGILLRGFQEQSSKKLWPQLKDILQCYCESSVVIEIVPISTLCEMRTCREAMKYNQELLLSNIKHKILALRKLFRLQ